MTVCQVLQIGHPTLRKRSIKVTRFDARLAELADDLVETMHAAQGVGLAAPQIGVLARVIVVEMPDEEGYVHPGERFIVCNPKPIKTSRETEVGQEGCLSVAGYIGLVERPVAAIIEGQDLRGKPFRVKATGFFARAFLHEIDHLNGVLYVDLAEEGSVMTLEEMERLREQQARQGADDETPVLA